MINLNLLKDIPLNLEIRFTPFLNYQGKLVGGYYIFFDKENFNQEVAKFKLTQMGGCNGVCISSNEAIYGTYKGKGYGNTFNKIREDLAQQMGYSVMLCTVIDGNVPQEKILFKNGWARTFGFLNLKTSNDISMFYKKI